MSDQQQLERKPRAQQTRVAEESYEDYGDSWENPGLLDTSQIPAKPGFVQRWVRTSINGQDDQTNVYKKINNGWRVRTADSVEKGQFVPTVGFNNQNVIGIHGMILMERPKAINDRQAAYNRHQADAQMTAVRNNMFNVHQSGSGLTKPSMKHSTDVTRGRLVEADDDD